MIFIDFDLLGTFYVAHTAKYLTYVLTLRYVLYDSVCEDNSRIYGKCRQRFYQTFTKV